MGRIGEGGEQAQVWPEGRDLSTHGSTLSLYNYMLHIVRKDNKVHIYAGTVHMVISQLKLPIRLTLSFVRSSALNNLWEKKEKIVEQFPYTAFISHNGMRIKLARGS